MGGGRRVGGTSSFPRPRSRLPVLSFNQKMTRGTGGCLQRLHTSRIAPQLVPKRRSTTGLVAATTGV